MSANQQLRARQRRRQARRDEIARRLHRELVEVRKFLKGLFAYEGACGYRGFSGPTPREPKALYYLVSEAVFWARSEREMPESLFADAEAGAKKCVDRLNALYQELDQAMDAVGLGRCEVDSAMLDQRQAMKDFDRVYKESARTIQAPLIFAGLPTLAAAVRPGVGRQGRPLKQQPVDLYPDLVERVRNKGLIELDVRDAKTVDDETAPLAAESGEAGNGSGRVSTARQGADDETAALVANSDSVDNGSGGLSTSQDGIDTGTAGHVSVSTAPRNGSACLKKNEHPLHERLVVDEKVEHPLHERSAGDEINEHPLHERLASHEKIEHHHHQRSTAEEKSEHPLHELRKSDASDVFSRLTPLPPAAASCGEHRDRSYRPIRRSGGASTGRSPLRRMKGAASAWWERLLRAA